MVKQYLRWHWYPCFPNPHKKSWQKAQNVGWRKNFATNRWPFTSCTFWCFMAPRLPAMLKKTLVLPKLLLPLPKLLTVEDGGRGGGGSLLNPSSSSKSVWNGNKLEYLIKQRYAFGVSLLTDSCLLMCIHWPSISRNRIPVEVELEFVREPDGWGFLTRTWVINNKQNYAITSLKNRFHLCIIFLIKILHLQL